MCKSLDVAQWLIDATFADGGATVWTGYSEQKTGFLVSTDGYERTVNPALFTEPLLVEHVRNYFNHNAHHGDAIGLWIDRDNGLLYLDVNRHFYSYDAALQYATDNRQIAIYSLGDGMSLPVGRYTHIAA